MRIAILGTGFVAAAYMRTLLFLGYHPLVLSREWYDYSRLGELLRTFNPEVVVNAVGWSGVTIDDCESGAGRTKAYQANCAFVHGLLKALRGVEPKLIHLSTGCMFHGAGPFGEWNEGNNTAPAYVSMKLAAEEEVMKYDRAFVFRIRMPFNHTWHPRNLLVKLTRYPEILEGENSLTFLDEFCMRSWQIVQKEDPPRLFHAVYPTPVNTKTIVEMLTQAGLRTLPYAVYSPDKFLADGHVRRSQAVLCAERFEKSFGAPFGDPMVALRWCIDRMKESRPS